jgi:hypothetical protein
MRLHPRILVAAGRLVKGADVSTKVVLRAR